LKTIYIESFADNPLMKPNPQISWMSSNILNCGVVFDEEAKKWAWNGIGGRKWIMLFGTSGEQSKFSLGLALSQNGQNWEIVLKESVSGNSFNKYCQGNIENLRIIKWPDGWYYVFATMKPFNDFCLGFWKTKDFFRFKWVMIPFEKPIYNAAIFPEMIGNRAYLIYQKNSDFLISKTRDRTLKKDWENNQTLIEKEKFLKNFVGSNQFSEIRLVAPPIKTPRGWLVFSHLVDNTESPKKAYYLSFLVLNFFEPEKVEYIHSEPIFCLALKQEKEIFEPMTCFVNSVVDPGVWSSFLYFYWREAENFICGGKIAKNQFPMCYP